MKPTGATVNTLPERLADLAPELRFPSKKLRPAQLRKLRDRLLKQGNTKPAISVARALVRIDPGRESYFKLGVLYNEAGKYRKAIKEFKNALRYQDGPKYLITEIHAHNACSWRGLGNWKRMSAALRRVQASRYKPRNVASLHMSLGSYYLSTRKFRAAAEEFEKAEKAYRDRRGRARAASNSGFAYLRSGEVEAASRHLDRSLRIYKKIGGSEAGVARMMRAAAHLDQGHLQQAFSLFHRACRQFRTAGRQDREAEALWNAGYAASELGNWARCRTYQDRAIRLASESGNWCVLVPAYALRATACAHQEDFEPASADMARAQMLMRGRRYWLGSLHVYRAQSRIAELFGNWIRVSRIARSAERLALKVGDTPRVIEFRRMRARSEEQRGRRRVALYARKGAARLEKLLVSGSSRGRQFLRMVQRLASAKLPILIVGESGTGKVELAQELHRLSRRSRHPCVVVPCEQLRFPEVDLQGHAPGAWSGAKGQSLGFVGRAERGTLVLDRIDDLSLRDQRVLLRLVDGSARAVGDALERAVDVRVVATCEDRTRLLPGLRDRLEGAVLRLRSLRERSEEIPEIVKLLLQGRREITGDATAILSAHSWDGNLPELRAVVERLVANTRTFIGRKSVSAALKVSDSCRDRAAVYKKRQLRQMAVSLA